MKRTLFAIPIALLLLALRLTACAEETEPDTFTSGDYTYILPENGAAEITGYWGKAENLTIPDQLDGHPVTAIRDFAFSDCSSLTSVSIPDSVTAIGDRAFSNCSNLTLSVGRDSYAFQYCKENGLNYTYNDSLDWLNN